MGFRSTFITEDIAITWPEWFKGKYKFIHFPAKCGCISSKFEVKLYCGVEEELFLDIQKVVFDANSDLGVENFIIVILHECGGISRVQISKESIRMTEPPMSIKEWAEVVSTQHSYCYGCSDIE